MGRSALCGQIEGHVLQSPSDFFFLKRVLALSVRVGVEICFGGRENYQTMSTGDSTASTPVKHCEIIERQCILKINLIVSYLQIGFAFISFVLIPSCLLMYITHDFPVHVILWVHGSV